jgi:RNA polymerase sigma-70 factor (ECF subfamily)
MFLEMSTAAYALPGTFRARSSTLRRMEPGGLSDEQLLEQVAISRDSEAFEILYSRYSRAIYSLVQRVLRDHHAADDVSQEAFAAVWRAARGYRRERGTASAWLFAIARNAAVDAARARVPLVVGEAPDVPDQGPLPETMAIAEMEAFEVHVAVDSLPDREREVIELAYYSGLSQTEISDRLSLPLGTVKTRTRTALARLADVLGERGVMR